MSPPEIEESLSVDAIAHELVATQTLVKGLADVYTVRHILCQLLSGELTVQHRIVRQALRRVVEALA